MTKLSFKAVRTVYFENDKRKVTTKKYETYKQAKAYAKRYSKLVNGASFVEVEVKFDTDSFKFKNVDIFVADSNGFENEHLEEIEKFQKETEEQKSEKRYNFYVKDYTEKRDVPIVYSDYTKKEIIKEVQGWADKNNHVYKIFTADKTSDKTLAGRVFFKVINWKPIFKVGKTGSRLQFGEFNYEDAEAYCKEYARKDGIAYTIYEVKFDKFGRDEFVPVTDIEPPEKVVGFRVGLGGKIYKTEAEAFANNPKENDIKTLHEWEEKGGNFTDFCKVGDKVDKGIVDYFLDVLPPITWRTDLVQCGEPYGHRDNPKTGRWEAMYITFSKNDKGQWYYAGICFLNQREAIA